MTPSERSVSGRRVVTVDGRTANFCGHPCGEWGLCDLPLGHDGSHGWDYEAGESAYVNDGPKRGVVFTGDRRS